MLRRCAVLLFAVLAATSAVAVEPPATVYYYIVPVTGSVESAGGIFHSYTRVINLASQGASVAVEVYPADRNARCIRPVGGLPAGQFTTLAQLCEGIYGLSIASTQPLYVRSEVLSYTRERFLEGPNEEPIPVANAFFAATDKVLIPDVPGGGRRISIVIVNPDSGFLNATISGLKETDPSMSVSVAPESIRLVPVTQLVVSGDSVSGARHFVVTADRRFQAGASSVADNGQANYRAAVAFPASAPSGP